MVGEDVQDSYVMEIHVNETEGHGGQDFGKKKKNTYVSVRDYQRDFVVLTEFPCDKNLDVLLLYHFDKWNFKTGH